MKRKRDWSTLPEDLLITIFHLLNSHISLLRLRAVCPSWRSSLPLSLSPHDHHPFPLITPPPPPCNTFPYRGHYSVVKTTVFCLSTPPRLSSLLSTSFIMKIYPSRPNENTNFTFLYPFKTENINLPEINLLDVRVTEVAHSYSLRFTLDANPSKHTTIKKVAVILTNDSNNSSYTVCLSYDSKLYRWKTGETSWTLIHDVNSKHNKGKKGEEYGYFDLLNWAFFERQWYAVNLFGSLMKFDCDFNPTLVVQSTLGHTPPGELLSLVPSNGELYLVNTRSYGVNWRLMRLFEMIRVKSKGKKCRGKKNKWEECKKNYLASQRGQVLYVGVDVAFSVSASDFHGCCKPGCIYITSACFGGKDDSCVYEW